MVTISLLLLFGLCGPSAAAQSGAKSLGCRAKPRIAEVPSASPVPDSSSITLSITSSSIQAIDLTSSAVTVATDGSGQFANVQSAISYAQANSIPTVTVKAGTYTEAISIQATAAVTIVGEAAATGSAYSDNLVTLSNGGANSPVVSFGTSAANGVAWRNINFVNSNPDSTAGVIFLRGSRNAFYSCQFTAAGQVGFTGSHASGIVADSYIEASDKVLYGYASLYIYGTTITATKNSALLVYNRGDKDVTGTLYNSTVVFDTCQVSRKPGATNTNVFLAAANGEGSVVVFRETFIAGFIASTGVYVDAKTQSSANSYIEAGTSGPGSYANNAVARAPYVSLVTDLTNLAPYDVGRFFASANPSVAVSDTAWVDGAVLSRIQKARSDSSTSTSSLPLSTPSSEVSSTPSATTPSPSTTSTAAACLPSYIPSTALVVGPRDSPCATYNSVAAAVAALPNDSTDQYIYILAGTYQEQIRLDRVGATVIRGESDNAMSWSSNKVTIRNSSGVLSSAGGSAGTATFSATKYEAKLVAFYNINFENSYSAAANNVAIASYSKGTKVAFYSCNVKSSQGSLYLDYGNVFFSGGRIEGTTDFVWGIGAGYFYNSVIVSTSSSTSQTIAAQRYQGQYGGSRLVFDGCAVIPSSNAVPQRAYYLGRDYSTNAQVAYINSYLDAHISTAGWLIANAASFTGTFAEANNTGPGYTPFERASVARVLTDASSYSVKNVLGDDTWLDSSAIAPRQAWPDSMYGSSSTKAGVTPTSTETGTPTPSSASSTFTVAPSPGVGEYGTVSSAVEALPADGKDYTILIKAGSYEEQVSITRAGKVTLRGETSFANDFTQNTVLIKFSRGVSTSLGQNEQTPVLNWKNTAGDGIALYNINFTNTYPQQPNTAALAADFFGTKMAAYGCAFSGFQDTLLVNQGVQVFSNCYVDGSVDFIWGYSKAYFHQCYIASNTAGAYITAQNRPNPTWAGGFVFDKSVITYTPSLTTFGTTYLGRPWSQYAVTVYMNSFLDRHIAPEGWAVWQTSNPQTSNVLFGEYNNTGPGNWTSSRASFSSQLTESQASQYSLGSFIGDTSWLDGTAYDLMPSYSLTKSANTPGTEPTSPVPSHPTSGTEPPEGAVLVAADGSNIEGAYTSLSAALASLPKDASAQVVFMYPGTYNEQVPAVNRPGPVMIIGYTSDAPGKSYQNNQVTITQSRGLSVSPPPAGYSNAETATVATTSTKISWYNINLANSDNLDGAKPSYVTLAASIYGDKIAFYGCSFVGWQDTLLTGAGNQYYESCYIDGAIDFIWGYATAYFKGCTVAAKRAKSAITAHSRASLSAIGGYVFDQCLFTEAASATVDLKGQVYLGRPYSKYALVVVKNSYLGDVIQPAGWKVWSATDPRTDHITFAEYNNVGPGSWENNAAARQAFGNCTLLSDDVYPLTSVMSSTDWIDMTYWDQIQTPQPAVVVPSQPGPYDGTKPPAGALVVSKTPIDGQTTYNSIQAALSALPASSKTIGIVFIYPGIYDEQLVLNKSGTTMLIGYSDSPGDYSQNKVTINFNKGIDTQADASNSDSATVYAAGNYMQAVNINFANTFGTTPNFASLGFGVKSSKYASLYGCQVYGNQDSLLVNGFLFASNSYIEGNIDMIWGSGAGYFLNSTISPNRDGVALTASKRATNTTAAGFVFDQCTVVPAKGASYSSISLGRPWNANARVAYIGSHLGSCVKSAGWDQWTKTDPRTSGVMFGEFANDGPGAGRNSRASFATDLTAETAAQFELANFFSVTSWINMTLVSAVPFKAGSVVVPTPTSVSTPISTSTVYVTMITTLKQTDTTTVQAPDTTTTVKTTLTSDAATTITLAATTKTASVKSTTTHVETLREPDTTITVKAKATVDTGTTITLDAVTETSTSVVTSTVTDVVTEQADTITTTSTVFTTRWETVLPKAVTTTQVIHSTGSFTKTSMPKPTTVKMAQTITIGNGGTTTVIAKDLTITSVVRVTSTKTMKKTTTLGCIPTKAPSRRWNENLEKRAVGDPTVTITVLSTLSTFVKKSTFTLPGTTVTTNLSFTKTIGKTSTVKPSTVTETAVSLQTRLSTTTISGNTLTTTTTEVISAGKTKTLKPSTNKVVVTSVKTVVAKSTIQPPDVTETATVTNTQKATSTLPQIIQTVTLHEDTKVTRTIILPVSTATVWTTIRSTLKPTETVTRRSTVTKTSTSKIAMTVTSWVTKTTKGAKSCTV